MSTADHEEQKSELRSAALEYHEKPTPGKISVTPTKQLVNQRDLALAYTPGVAAASEAIHADPAAAFRYTARGNLVGVVTNGTAVLGLGAIGPLAAKPVMEGKAVLFKKFAGIDVFDIEVNELDPDKLIEIIAALEPTFGGINLEDIKAPECFYIERTLRERMKIPVFHDDQHGTAIIVGAAVLNGLSVVGKDIKQVKLVTSGAGAAALACLQLLVELGLPRENIWVTDIEGVVYQGRKVLMDEDKARFAQVTPLRKLSDVIEGADVFLGLSAAGVLKPEMVKKMAARPLILALANPTPEIMPEQVKAVRADAIIATGRSDYVNQVNNVLCFPFIFRGALDVGATSITTAMETAAVRALAGLAREEQSDIVASAYGVADVSFGPEYLIPKPFDPRLITRIAPAVAQAAMASGVATRPIDDIQAYRDQLQQFVYHSGTFMKPIFAIAKNAHAGGGKSRIVFAEGEEERVMRAVQVVIDEKLARPILIGRPAIIGKRLERFGLRMRPEVDFDLINPEFDSRYRDYWETYHRLAARKGVTQQYAKIEMRRRLTLIGAMMMHKGEADGMLCGTFGTHTQHLAYIDQVLGRRTGANVYAAMNILMVPGRQLALVDTMVNLDPTLSLIHI
jgi:malate dehydrogenase (oxaloacetate-decarboxylating)(NADP+)